MKINKIFNGWNATAVALILMLLLSCKKSDNFYSQLKSMPQIDQSTTYAYPTSYMVGDIMKITGFLQPDNNLVISIGGIQADIVKIDSVKSPYGNGSRPYMDVVSLQLTQGMAGVGKSVKVTSGGHSADGPPVDIYISGGPGSFTNTLSAVKLAELPSAITFLYCMNGKGDVYYYTPSGQTVTHIKKDGTQAVVANLSGTAITSFLAGAVDPAGDNLYYSVQSGTVFLFKRMELATGNTVILNQSPALSLPYEGPLAAAHLVVTGAFPDSKGNIFLSIGNGNSQSTTSFLPDAIALYSKADGNIHYLYKGLADPNKFPDMPGLDLGLNNTLTGLRFSPDEGLLYALQSSFIDFSGAFTVIDLTARLKIQDFTTNNADGGPSQYRAIGPFSNVHINIRDGSVPDWGYGFMPMPGRRLQLLVYQNYQQAANYGFPKWVVMDFSGNRTYAYAPDQFQANGYTFKSGDLMLNYDESGNLYSTALNRAFLVKTQAQ